MSEFDFADSIEIKEPAERLDAYLTAYFTELSRSRLQKLIKEGLIKVNGQAVKPSCPLEAGDVVEVFVPVAAPVAVEAENIPLDIVYEDEDVIVVNKPRGMVVHPAVGNYTGTLVNALLYHCRDLSGINGELRPGIVHRIDKETSGLIIAAKNDRAHKGLVEQWQTREVKRYYKALLHGSMGEPGGTVDAPIGRHPKDRKKMAVVPLTGRPAVTHYKILERFGRYTLIEAKLDTGRTHQIRVHMQYLGHPVVGDIIYGPKGRSAVKIGMLLHSAVMEFRQPCTDEIIKLEAPVPADFAEMLEQLRSGEFS
ncbi:MAG: RluA family pseudouridine synthase [Bacillota bacterium]|jgi:23S rRNA pseudouridine1911/1915/1917 synthase